MTNGNTRLCYYTDACAIANWTSRMSCIYARRRTTKDPWGINVHMSVCASGQLRIKTEYRVFFLMPPEAFGNWRRRGYILLIWFYFLPRRRRAIECMQSCTDQQHTPTYFRVFIYSNIKLYSVCVRTFYCG